MSLATVSAWPDVPSESAIGDTSKAAQLVETSKLGDSKGHQQIAGSRTCSYCSIDRLRLGRHRDIHTVFMLGVRKTRQTMTRMGHTACGSMSTNSA